MNTPQGAIPPLIIVNNWSSLYENNRTREIRKLEWVPVPNRMDGDGYTELLDHPNGPAHLAAWIAILQIASRCDVRGTLSRQGAKPHDVESLARISRIPSSVFSEAIPRLVEIGWISLQVTENSGNCTIPQGGAVPPQEGASSRTRAHASVPFSSIPFSSPEGGVGETEIVPLPLQVSEDTRFRRFLECFAVRGTPISETDSRKCAMLWVSLTDAERSSALTYAAAMSAGDWSQCATRYVPRPETVLSEKRWTRIQFAKPRDRPKTKSEESMDIAAAAFLAKQGASA